MSGGMSEATGAGLLARAGGLTTVRAGDLVAIRAGDVAVRAGDVAVRAGDVEPFGTDTPENPGLCGRMAVACRAPALNP